MDYRVIKEDDLFLLTDSSGNIPENHSYGLGLYNRDTRFLSKLDLKINDESPILLSSEASENYIAKILLTNPHIEKNGELILWRESVELERTRFISDHILYETIKVKNYSPKPLNFDISIHVDVDFADMFIVRGFQTGRIGKKTGQEVTSDSLTFHYLGEDKLYRATKITWDKEPKYIRKSGDVGFDFSLKHDEEQTVTLMIQPQIGIESKPSANNPNTALSQLRDSYKKWEEGITKISTDFQPLQRLVDRGIGDLRVLLTDWGHGKFPVAGLPWFGVPFGRDSIIAALQMLAFNPEIAKGTLQTLAHFQGKNKDSWKDEEPGKIMHEIRFGELAITGQIPFTPYYGTIDATPLFLILLTEYVRWTGDLEFFKELKENVEAGLNWIDKFGDRDNDLFVEYHQEASKGLGNQGWKDSGDSIVHRSGDLAKSPIALVEVQGYVYQSKIGIAEIYESMGKKEDAEKLRNQASQLKQKFVKDFWMEDVSFLAMALDENKDQVGTLTSNPGHVLLSEILEKDKADEVVKTLISPKMFSGYGIRTMAEGENGYNPMSYHDGSVWPHDNSMTILGMSKLGYQEEANLVMEGLIDAADHFEYDRLPELFCGYSNLRGKAIKYPVACSPQAWAAGTPLIFIQSILGVFPNSLKKEIALKPNLLTKMNTLRVSHLSIGNGELSFDVERNFDGSFDVKINKNTTGYSINIQNGCLVQ